MIKDFKIFEFQQLPKKVKVDKSDRIIYSNDKEIKFKNISLNRQKEDNWGFKPLGLWYGFGDDWLKHIVRAGFDRDYSTIFKINITHNILILNLSLKDEKPKSHKDNTKKCYLHDSIITLKKIHFICHFLKLCFIVTEQSA